MATTASKSFLGTGWGFPVFFHKEHGTDDSGGNPEPDGSPCYVQMASEIEDIEQSLTILLTTRPGERVMRPDYGCSLEDLMFEPGNESLLTYVRNLVDRSILYYEPRIKLESVEILGANDLLEGRLVISVYFTIRSTNSRFNYVYDFYKREATVVAQ